MNERILELADKAAEDSSSGPWNISDEFCKKFAQLIVKECAKVCRDQPNHYALKADRDNCAIAIEQHFGVEE
jgi:hypothetical protein